MLDHNARLFFELDPQGGNNNLYSFYCEYSDYLDDQNLIDVSASNLTNYADLEMLIKKLFIKNLRITLNLLSVPLAIARLIR